ncbi:hypothetical protein LRS06_22165 [Hymenobacter sp. J193]|uniref:hypothetical protein n=1 Tax=Hymenobacter sp. J193 TaxID=2898429 RepID=UPI002150AD01|nr:hypothetical protein [Hymenobacter sp. J193]MCR5890436.1 hypothetical protein [Hymenobacter sp. J193]
MNDAFCRLQQEAADESGTDAYSGSFYTISEYTDKTDEWRNSGLSASEFLNQGELLDELDKRSANGVCLRPPTKAKEGKYMFVGWAAE